MREKNYNNNHHHHHLTNNHLNNHHHKNGGRPNGDDNDPQLAVTVTELVKNSCGVIGLFSYMFPFLEI